MRAYIPPDHIGIPAEAERVFKGVIFDVYQWQQEMFDGSYATFERLRRPDTVEVICIVEDTILISKEQQPDTKEFLTIPGGRHDNEVENELQAAQREVREELGYTFKNWKLIDTKQFTGKIDHLVYTFVATEVESVGEQALDAGEKIEVLKYTFEDFKKLSEDPKARYSSGEIISTVHSLEELKALPSLHTYQKN